MLNNQTNIPTVKNKDINKSCHINTLIQANRHKHANSTSNKYFIVNVL